jgi:hypothetical protein
MEGIRETYQRMQNRNRMEEEEFLKTMIANIVANYC